MPIPLHKRLRCFKPEKETIKNDEAYDQRFKTLPWTNSVTLFISYVTSSSVAREHFRLPIRRATAGTADKIINAKTVLSNAVASRPMPAATPIAAVIQMPAAPRRSAP